MKRVLLGFPFFLVAFFAGYFLVPEIQTILPNVGKGDQTNSEAAPVVPSADDLLSESPWLTPEFTDVELDEEASKTSMLMELVSNGKVAFCTNEPKKAERKWLGLFKRGERFSLERRSVDFGPVESIDFGNFSSMNFRGSREAVFILSDQGTLRPGPVRTLYLKPNLTHDQLFYDGMELGYSRIFRLDDTDYVIRIAPATLRGGNSASVLLIEQGSRSQIIWFKTFFGSPGDIGELEWVGDLDGDGRLDLQLSHYAQNGGQFESLLFLSSFAKKGRLVGFAAFYSARCRA